MSKALITKLEALTKSTAAETPLFAMLQEIDDMMARLPDLTGEEAKACERAAMTACAALGALAGRMVSAHDTCTGLEGSAGLQHISITDLADRCWRAVAACQAAWALFEVLVQPKDMSVQTFRWLLTNCGTTFAAACSLMLQLCCAAAQLGPSVQQQVAASLAAAAEEVLPPLAVALHATGTVFDGSAARLPAAFKPAGLTVLLQDIIGIMQFVGATTGPAPHNWSPRVWECLELLLDLSTRDSTKQKPLGQRVLQLRSLAAATHKSLFAEFARKGFTCGWGRSWWCVLGVLTLSSYAAQVQPVPQDDSTICEQCGVLLGLLPLVGGSQAALVHAVHCAAELSSACGITLNSAMQQGAQPLSAAQLLLCFDACTLCAAATMAAVELGSNWVNASCPQHPLPTVLVGLGNVYGLLVFRAKSWGAAGEVGRDSGLSSTSGSSKAAQLAASAAETAECGIRLAGLLLRQWGSIEGSLVAVGHLAGAAMQLLQSIGRIGASGTAALSACCSATVSAAKLALTILELPEARQVQWSSDPGTQPNHAASILLLTAVECCAVPADEELQDSLGGQLDAAVLSLIYAGQQVALSSSNCKEDVGCATKLLLLAEQLAKSSALLFHHLGGSQLLTSACMRLLECNFAEFVSAQPDLSSVAYILNDTGGVGLQAGVTLAACGFLERLLCWVVKGLEKMPGKASKKLRYVLVNLRNVVVACCLNVVYEAHQASGQPAAASCHDCASCRWRRQHVAWFEGAPEKQLCSPKMWVRFRQEALPHLAGSAAAAARARQEAVDAARDAALQRAATAVQGRACAHLGCTNLQGCCEGRLPGRKRGGAERFCSPECLAAAEGQLARLCNQAA